MEGAGAGARFHLAVARADVAYRKANGTLGCWSDTDPSFATRHVEMARSTVRSDLAALSAQAPRLTALSFPTQTLLPPDGAGFRSRVRTLVEFLHPLCQITTAGDNDQIMAPARADVRRLRERLQSSSSAGEFDLAEADALYERSITSAECMQAGESTATATSRNALAETRRQIAPIAAMVDR